MRIKLLAQGNKGWHLTKFEFTPALQEFFLLQVCCFKHTGSPVFKSSSISWQLSVPLVLWLAYIVIHTSWTFTFFLRIIPGNMAALFNKILSSCQTFRTNGTTMYMIGQFWTPWYYQSLCKQQSQFIWNFSTLLTNQEGCEN